MAKIVGGILRILSVSLLILLIVANIKCFELKISKKDEHEEWFDLIGHILNTYLSSPPIFWAKWGKIEIIQKNLKIKSRLFRNTRNLVSVR